MYGCRVIQKALESIPLEQQKLIIAELEGKVTIIEQLKIIEFIIKAATDFNINWIETLF